MAVYPDIQINSPNNAEWAREAIKLVCDSLRCTDHRLVFCICPLDDRWTEGQHQYRDQAELDGSVRKKSTTAQIACVFRRNIRQHSPVLKHTSCAIISMVIRAHAKAFVSIPDSVAAKGMRILSSPIGGDPIQKSPASAGLFLFAVVFLLYRNGRHISTVDVASPVSGSFARFWTTKLIKEIKNEKHLFKR